MTLRCLFLLVTVVVFVKADDIRFVWDPITTSASWSDPNSWDLGRVPNKYDDVTINVGAYK